MIVTELAAGALQATCRRMGVVMEPDGTFGESAGVLNPGVARDRDGRLLLFPRLVSPGNISRIGIARYDGLGPVERIGIALEAARDYERRDVPGGFGCEDARVTFIAELGTYVMAYTAYGPAGARVAVAVSEDAYAWTRLGPVQFSDAALNAVDNKDAAFFPESVLSPDGVPSIAFFHRPMRGETIGGQTPIPVIMGLPPEQREATCLAYVPVERAKRDIRALIAPTESIRILDVGGSWGLLKNGAGTPPIKTSLGWLSVFHAVDAVAGASGMQLWYSAGILVNDLQRPHHVVYRSPEPILVPETAAERFGTVDDVVFPTGIDVLSERAFDIYYGAADAKISRARIEFAPPR
jgi:predicted GH43/DUF377 family glycosyl hydrolase